MKAIHLKKKNNPALSLSFLHGNQLLKGTFRRKTTEATGVDYKKQSTFDYPEQT